MNQLLLIEQTAELIIRRVLADVKDTQSLPGALDRANPFGENPFGRHLWMDALLRHACGRERRNLRPPTNALSDDPDNSPIETRAHHVQVLTPRQPVRRGA